MLFIQCQEVLRMEKTVIELFAGVGGFRCGLNKVKLKNEKVSEMGNWKFVWANQWEPATKSQEAYECYIKRFGKDDVSNVDIFEVDKKKIPDHTLLVGGFPCQDYSVARTLSGSKGLEGKKGVLWWAIVDTIKAKKPPFLFLENVDRLLLSPANQRGRDFGMILRSLYENGYAVEWRVINASEYKEPQKRRRTYIFAYHKSTKYYGKMKKLNMKDIIVSEGIFAKQFPIKKEELDYNIANVSKKMYKDLVDVSDNFQTQFYNTGVMCDGKVYTAKMEPKCKDIYPLKKVREIDEVADKYFLTDEKIEKFKYLKGSKRFRELNLMVNLICILRALCHFRIILKLRHERC